MHGWLTDRTSSGETISGGDSFKSSVRTLDELCTFKVSRNTALSRKETIVLSGFLFESLSAGRALLEVPESGATFISQITDHTPRGCVVIASSTNAGLMLLRSSILSITEAHDAGDLTEYSDPSELYDAAASDLIVLSVQSSDSLDALLKLRELKIDLKQLGLLGVICQGVARGVCSSCARETVIDSKIINELPLGLKPKGNYRYLVGRGCNQCGHAGYKGSVAILSILKIDETVLSLFSSGASESEIAEHTYFQGTAPLLEDGVKKALTGKLTFESLFQIVKVVPTVYERFYLADSAPREPVASRYPSYDSCPLFPAKGVARQRPLVLVVEDDADQQSILDMCLKSANYETALARDGTDALRFLEGDVPDLILTDLMMPQMDGYDLTSKLKADGRYRRIPVLVLTVISDVEKEYALLDLGADDYCEKTIQRKILLKRVENLLKRSRMAPSAITGS